MLLRKRMSNPGFSVLISIKLNNYNEYLAVTRTLLDLNDKKYDFV